MANKVMLAGASGHLGRHIAKELKRRSHHVRGISRSAARIPDVDEQVTGDLTSPSSLRDKCHGVDTVISCAGAMMDMGKIRERKSFHEVDYRGNKHLLDEALRSGVDKFVYVSLAHAAELRQTAYADAHEKFVEALRTSGMEYRIIRPTGFFCFFGEILKFAKKGRGIIIGNGECRTNPVHESEVARACVDSMTSEALECEIGGPEVLTRKEVTELAFEVVGSRPKLTSVAPGFFSAMIAPARLLNPRIHALMEFGIAVTQIDVIAPPTGTLRLKPYFEALLPSL